MTSELDLAKRLCTLVCNVSGACSLQEKSQLLDQIHESVICMDLNGFITDWNKSAETLFGYSSDEAIGKHILFLYADPNSDDDEEILAGVGADADVASVDATLGLGGREMEVRRRRKSGEMFWASLKLSLVRDENGQPTGMVGFLNDITERIEAEKAMRLQSCIFEFSEECITITDAARKILSVNSAFSKMTGFSHDEVIGADVAIMRCDKHDDSFYDDIWRIVDQDGRWQGEVWSRRKNGDAFPGWASISLVRNREGHVSNYFSVLTDITERKRAEERIHHLAYYDPLTNLPNRTMLLKLVDQALARALRNRQDGAILFIDLNRFKPINDTLGHDIGDRLLSLVAGRLRDCVRNEDVVARIGGDEFVVALFDLPQRENASLVAEKLLAALDPPFLVDSHELKVGASIGISTYPRDGGDTESLLRMADIAMYRVKQGEHDGYTFYSREMNQRALDRMQVENGLRNGIDNNEMLLYFQPKVDVASGAIVGAEALVRWRHPQRGMVPPGEFIPIAEESGLVVRLSAWVLNAAMEQACAWRDAGLEPVKIAVNLSARDFSPDLAARVRSLLARHDISPQWIELEITEGMLTHSSDQVIAMMDELADFGITLALDDFGTGYSSLSYLKRFPIDTLKIDKSFVRGIPDDGDDCAIAGAIISMAQSLGHEVIAEGVETEAQLDYLRTLGCKEVQGFFFSPPMSPEKFESMLRCNRSEAN